jgi:hypothetical protein
LAKPTGILFLSVPRQTYFYFPVELWLTVIFVGWPSGETIPVGIPNFPVGIWHSEIFLFLVVRVKFELEIPNIMGCTKMTNPDGF